MDWIERLFHVAPDGGTGSLEVGIVAGVVVALAMMIAGAIKLTSAVRGWFASGVSAARGRTDADDRVRRSKA